MSRDYHFTSQGYSPPAELSAAQAGSVVQITSRAGHSRRRRPRHPRPAQWRTSGRTFAASGSTCEVGCQVGQRGRTRAAMRPTPPCRPPAPVGTRLHAPRHVFAICFHVVVTTARLLVCAATVMRCALARVTVGTCGEAPATDVSRQARGLKASAPAARAARQAALSGSPRRHPRGAALEPARRRLPGEPLIDRRRLPSGRWPC